MTEFDPPLDVGIAPFVLVLMDAGIETFESCQGGAGHSYPVPTVRFHGKRGEGFKALAALQECGAPVRSVRRIWTIDDGEPTGPYWEVTFNPDACIPRT